MKKAIKAAFTLFIFIAIVPALASLAITALWNSIIVAACGFAAIGFWQGVGLFLLGQIITGGFVFGMFLAGGSLHRIFHHDGDWHGRWHGMSDEERREFIKRRRMQYFGFRNHKSDDVDGGE